MGGSCVPRAASIWICSPEKKQIQERGGGAKTYLFFEILARIGMPVPVRTANNSWVEKEGEIHPFRRGGGGINREGGTKDS